MTRDIAEHLRKMSSRNGRYWLRDSARDDSANDLPFGTITQPRSDSDSQSDVEISRTHHESVVVAIPDVAAQNHIASRRPVEITAAVPQQPAVVQRPPTEQAPVQQMSVPQQTALVETQAPVDSAASIAAAVAVPAIQPTTENATQVRVDESEAVIQPTVTHRVATQTPALVGSNASVDLHPPVTPLHDDAVAAARSSQSAETANAIIKIADEIVYTFPIASPSVVMIAGSEASLAVDETAARVSAELASRGLGRVLLIDSDFADHRLTSASGVEKHAGLSEVMNIALPWSEAILKSGSSKLDFMPAGICAHKRWTPKRLLREALAEIRQDYQFVCVSVGDAHSSAASTWSEMSDGAMLVVSASNSSDALAESAVHELRKDGARLLGCIVADASE